VHLLTRGHFWSCDEDGAVIVAVYHTRKPHATRKPHGSMVHSVSGCLWGVQVKLGSLENARAIPEHLRCVITTRRYTNPRLPLPYLTSMFHRSGIVADRSFTLREYIFWTVFAAVILTR